MDEINPEDYIEPGFGILRKSINEYINKRQ